MNKSLVPVMADGEVTKILRRRSVERPVRGHRSDCQSHHPLAAIYIVQHLTSYDADPFLLPSEYPTMSANGVNGVHSSVVRPLTAGIYAPIPTFFLPESEDLGWYFEKKSNRVLKYV